MEKSQQQKEFNRYKELIESIKTGVLITHQKDNDFNGRPMNTVEVDEEANLWFFTNEFSEKTQEVFDNHKVFLSYADPSANSYIVLSGSASVITDKSKMQKLWSPLKAWFPGGLDDPNMALLKVKPEQAEYWDGSANKIVVLFKMLSAILKGEQYKDGGHQKINM